MMTVQQKNLFDNSIHSCLLIQDSGSFNFRPLERRRPILSHQQVLWIYTIYASGVARCFPEVTSCVSGVTSCVSGVTRYVQVGTSCVPGVRRVPAAGGVQVWRVLGRAAGDGRLGGSWGERRPPGQETHRRRARGKLARPGAPRVSPVTHVGVHQSGNRERVSWPLWKRAFRF